MFGQGLVIKGWDQGILGMCVGEKCKLKIFVKFGYGDFGVLFKIFGGVILIFEIEFVVVNGKIVFGFFEDVLKFLMELFMEDDEEFEDDDEL